MPAEVVGPDDWLDWRQLRLEALREAPQAFCRTYDETLAWTQERWRELLGRPGLWWLVRREARPVAMASSWEQDGRHWLGAVYVTADARRQGLLEELVALAADRARAQDAFELLLEVHEENLRARAAYARLGFRDTGRRRPYPLGAGDELEMARRL